MPTKGSLYEHIPTGFLNRKGSYFLKLFLFLKISFFLHTSIYVRVIFLITQPAGAKRNPHISLRKKQKHFFWLVVRPRNLVGLQRGAYYPEPGKKKGGTKKYCKTFFFSLWRKKCPGWLLCFKLKSIKPGAFKAEQLTHLFLLFCGEEWVGQRRQLYVS